MLLAGEGRVDITPPVGIELAGFHRPAGQERRITGTRQPSEVRALALRVNDTEVAILSLDICALLADFCRTVQRRVEQESGIAAGHVRVCATHTHSMPTFRFFRQWGAISPEYMTLVEGGAVEAVSKARADLAEADCYIGKASVIGGNFNRTSKIWKTDTQFTRESTDADRWLDTLLQVLYFQRSGEKKSLQWYHFCAHPVCYGDTESGPDWPGLVAQAIKAGGMLNPSFLQGHIGDVNPGDGSKWIGDAVQTASAIAPVLHHATNHSEYVQVDELRVANATVEIPFDLNRLQAQLDFYRENAEQCTEGVWVDTAFAKAWYDDARTWDMTRDKYTTPVSALRLGDVALLFHPAELYSYYGLKLRFGSPFSTTLAVGYCDDFVGYLTDPAAFEADEYAAIVVPKITGLPPFTPDAARQFTAQCEAVLNRLT
jgi:hypothetical protein